jgi:hypothetical protein
MRGRAFLDVAKELLEGGTESHHRAATGRACYALMHECREAFLRWGVIIPPRESLHSFVRLRLNFPANVDLKVIGKIVGRLATLRNRADYDMSTQTDFVSAKYSQEVVDQATSALAILDGINADLARQTAAIAAIRRAFPPPPDKASN